MAKYELRFLDGTAITAIGDLQITCLTNDSHDLSLGSACAAMLEATLYGPVVIEGDTELSCFEDGRLLGRFRCEAPRRTGKNTLRLTAYDAMTCFDRDITAWLQEQAFPTTAQILLENLCGFCGVPLSPDALLPADAIPAFTQPGLTGRQLLQYIGQLAGRFFTVDPEGMLMPRWYGAEPVMLTGCRLGSLVHTDYTAAPITRVLIRTGENEVGAVWPDGSLTTENTYILQGNPLLPPASNRQAVAKRLWQQLKDYRCTPFSCTLLPGSTLLPGDTVAFTGSDGCVHTAPVMKLTVKNGQRSIQATASSALQSTEAFNRLALQALPGRMLTVERTADGLKAENTGLKGAAAALALTVEGITTRVSSAEEKSGDYALKSQISQLEQRADGLSLSVTQLRQTADGKADKEQVEELTEHFRFGSDGLTISNSVTGMGIGISEQQVAFHGGDSPTTVITPNAMQTTSLHIDTRLDIGGFSLLPRSNRNLSLRYTAG